MNIFRLVADMLHLAAMAILIYRIRKSRNCIGKSNTFNQHLLSHNQQVSMVYTFLKYIITSRSIKFLTDISIFPIGLSCKTQEIYLIVFCMRYADLFMYYVSLYNTLMKIFFISCTAFIIFMIRFKKPYCTVSKTLMVIIKRFSTSRKMSS
jgi:hypothetical protein